MNVKSLLSFLTVVDTGSINLAASHLFISPSALLKQINSVEEESGTQLLIRGHKGVELTEAGKVFYSGIKEIAPMYDEVLKKTRLEGQRTPKTLVIGSWSVACYSIIPQITNYYHVHHPEVELVFRNLSGISAIQEALQKRRIDVTFSFGGNCEAINQLRSVVLAKEPPVLCVPPTCELHVKNQMTLEDQKGKTIVTTDGALSGWFQYFNSYVEEKFPEVKLHVIYENESGLMDMHTLAAPSVGSRSIVPRDSNYSIIPLALPEDFDMPEISIDLICRDEKSALLDQFINTAVEAAKIIWFNR